MAGLLLITDDMPRGGRMARDLAGAGECRIHDLYSESLPAPADCVVSDVEDLNSGAVARLRHVLDRVCGDGVPHVFLVHGHVARSEAQARMLGATDTIEARSALRLLRAKLVDLSGRGDPLSSIAAVKAATVRRFFADALFSGVPITPGAAEGGTALIARAIEETGVRDWVAAVQRFDDVTHQHCLLVAGLATAFSNTLGLNVADRHRLAKAALLHDVGKTRVPATILNKPGRLDPVEMAIVRAHPAHGYDMLAGQGFEDVVLAVVRWHHEMLDGSGYPDGLRGRQIPDLVRLVTVCDIYAALIERRPYKAPMDGAAAFDVLEGMAGRLDAALVHAFQPVAATFAKRQGEPPPRSNPASNDGSSGRRGEPYSDTRSTSR